HARPTSNLDHTRVTTTARIAQFHSRQRPVTIPPVRRSKAPTSHSETRLVRRSKSDTQGASPHSSDLTEAAP
ncbi:MAG: hypothetical protein E6447_16960, partial [Bradyrhizobium sp.]|nr:hypothetical protein [Bradyrhizobium sp.]